MSQERIEVVERVLDAWNRRRVDELLALSHPEAEYVNPPDALEPGTRTGHDGLITVMTKQWEMLGDARMEIEAAHVRGDQVVTVQIMSRSLHNSPMLLEVRSAIRWSFRDGLISRLHVLGAGSSLRAGLEAAGIPPADPDAG